MNSKQKISVVVIGLLLSLVLFSSELFLLTILVGLVLPFIPAATQDSQLSGAPTQAIANSEVLNQTIHKLELLMNKEPNLDVARGIQRAIDEIRLSDATSNSPLSTQENSYIADIDQQVTEAVTHTAHATTDKSQRPDMTMSLLYTGAFLLLGGMSLFAVYGDFNGYIRLGAIISAALLFYSAGVGLWQTSGKLRPASTAFLAIGLVLIPLSGGSAIYLIDTSPAATWFVTSVIGLVLYGYALSVTRAVVMEYLSFILWLSLAVSVLNLTDMPVIWLVWSTLLVASVSLLFVHWLTQAEIIDLSESSQNTNTIVVPLAVGFGYVYNGVYSSSQLGVSLLLAALYYLTCLAVVSLDSKRREYYVLLAHFATLLGSISLLYAYLPSSDSFAFSLSVLGVLHAAAWVFGRRGLLALPLYSQTIYYTAASLTVVGWLLLTSNLELSLAALTVALATASLLTAAHYRSTMFGLAIFLGLVMPIVVAALVPGETSDIYAVSLSYYYLIVAALFCLVRYIWRPYSERVIALQVTYGFCLIAAWVAGLASGEFVWQLAASVATLLGFILISVYDRYPQVLYAVLPVGFSIAVILLDKLAPLMGWNEIIIYAAGLVSFCTYACSLLIQHSSYRLPLVISSITGIVVAWAFAAFMPEGTYILTYTAPILLAVASLVLLVEKKLFKGGPLFVLLPYFGLTLAVIHAIDLTWDDVNTLVYSHILVVYGVVASYLLSRRSSNKDLALLAQYATMTVFTLPVAIEALDSGGSYSLLLLSEQLALMVWGVATKRTYAVYWGATVSVLSVIYLLKSFFYIQLLVAAVILIGYAVYRLSKK